MDMADYNAQDLQSTLMYIKKRFGTNVFTAPSRVPALLSDLAPSLKEDRVMLERMSRLGILEGFVNTDGSGEREKDMFVSKTITRLTEGVKCQILENSVECHCCQSIVFLS